MKKFYFLVLSFLFSFASYSQVVSATNTAGFALDSRIAEVFGSQIALVQNDPQRLKDLNDILNHRTEIVTERRTSGEKYPKLSEMPLFNKYNPQLTHDNAYDAATFNILKYNLEFFTKYDKVYRIDNTDFIVIIHPQNLK